MNNLTVRMLACVALLCVAFGAAADEYSDLWSAACGNARLDSMGSVTAGAAQLTPGRYMSEARPGQGWDFFWYTETGATCAAGAQGCAPSINAPQDLFIAFYTFRNQGGAWIPIWYGAHAPLDFNASADARRGFKGELRTSIQTSVTVNGAVNVNPGPVEGEVMLAFAPASALNSSPDAVAVKWSLTPGARGAGTAADQPVTECLRNYRGLTLSEPRENPIDALSGAWSETRTTNWLVMPYFYQDFEHHVVLYYDNVSGLPRWVHAQVPLEGEASLPSTHACRAAHPSMPTLPSSYGTWRHLCMMTVRGFDPYNAAAGWQWANATDGAHAYDQIRLGWFSHTFNSAGVSDQAHVKVTLDPTPSIPAGTGVQAQELRFAPKIVSNIAPLLAPDPTVVTHLNNLSRVYVHRVSGGSLIKPGETCALGGVNGAVCPTTLNWYTDGAYPNAALFRARIVSGTARERQLIVRDMPRSSSVGTAYDFSMPGEEYEVELWSDLNRRELLAKSARIKVGLTARTCTDGGAVMTTTTPRGAVALPGASLAFTYLSPASSTCIKNYRVQIFRRDPTGALELVHEDVSLRDNYETRTHTLTDLSKLGDLSSDFMWRVQAFDGFGLIKSTADTPFTFITPTVRDVVPPAWTSVTSQLVSTPSGKAGVDGGAATYELPIRVAPGRNGMQPSLALTYSSRSGSGIAGIGWGLSGLSSVHRCAKTLAQDDVAEPVRFNASDALCLDGQRLMHVGGSARGTSGAQYRTEIDSNVLVVQQGNLAGGAVSFTAYTDDNQIVEYGAGNNSALSPAFAGLTLANSTLTWSISKRRDRSGNAIHYLYDIDAANGEQTLREIQYSGALNDANNRKVAFAYEARPTTGNAKDVSSSYFAGGLVMSTKRLTTITSSAPGTTSTFSYKLEYGAVSATSGRSVVRRIVPYAGTTALPAFDVSWSEGDLAFQLSRTVPTSVQSGVVITPDEMPITPEGFAASAVGARRETFRSMGDLDGDGWREGLYSLLGGKSYTVSFNPDRTLKSLFDVTDLSSPNGLAVTISDDIDVDNDGRADLVGRKRDSNLALIAFRKTTNPTSFTLADFDLFETNVAIGGNDAHLADLNGDGAADLLVDAYVGSTTPTCVRRITPYINQTPISGGNARAPTFIAIAPICLESLSTSGTRLEPRPIGRLDDFDGNGLPDLWIHYGSGLNDGSLRFMMFAQRSGPSGVTYTRGGEIGAGTPLHWVDVNGDGLLDWLGQNGAYKWIIRLNTGGTLGAVIDVGGANQAGLRYGETQIPPTAAGGAPLLAPILPDALAAGRFTSALQPFDVDSDGRAEILMPAQLVLPVCIYHFPERGSLSPPSEQDLETYFFCPSEVDGKWPYPAGAKLDGESIRPYYGAHSPGTAFDYSAYRMDAIEFVQTGPKAFDARVRTTPIVTRLSGGQADDFYGDGLSDLHASFGCPLARRATVPAVPPATGTVPYTGPDPCGIPLDRADNQAWPFFSLVGISPSSAEATALKEELRTKVRLFTSRNRGVMTSGIERAITPQLPDLVSRISWQSPAGTTWYPSAADSVEWNYHPLAAPLWWPGTRAIDDPLRTIPLYRIAARNDTNTGYVDAENFYFTSSMPVVSSMRESSGVGLSGYQLIERIFGYEDAMYENRGRGFRGFRRITEQNVATGLFSQTLFAQKFPFSGAATCSATATRFEDLKCADTTDNTFELEVTPPPAATAASSPLAISETKAVWQKARTCADSATGKPCWHVRPRLQVSRTMDLASRALISESRVSTSYDEFSQPVTSTTVTRDKSTAGVDQVTRTSTTTNRYDNAAVASLDWWRNRVVSRTSTQSVQYGGDQALPATQATSSPARTTTTLFDYDGLATRRPTCEAVFEGEPVTGTVCAFSGSAGASPPANFVRRTVTAYDEFGNAGSAAITAREGSPAKLSSARSSSVTFDPPRYFPTSTSNAAGHVSTMGGYNALLGLATVKTDPNGLTTTITYDALGREVGVAFPNTVDGLAARPRSTAYQWCSTTLCGTTPEALYRVIVEQQGAPTTISYYDRRSRVVRTETHGLTPTSWIATSREFSMLGDLIAERGPAFAGANGSGTVGGRLVTYGRHDALRRPGEKIVDQADLNTPAGGNGAVSIKTTYTYAGLTTAVNVAVLRNAGAATTEAPLKLSRTYATDGKLLRTVDANPTPVDETTTFWYDGAGNPSLIRDVKGQLILATYNDAGERTSVTDPSRGTWRFQYNGFGELTQQIDGRNYQSNYVYDALGRTVSRAWTDVSATNNTVFRYMRDTWTYDRDAFGVQRLGVLGSATRERVQGAGSTVAVTDNTAESVTQRFGYDTQLRPVVQETTLLMPGSQQCELLESSSTYDRNYGRLKTQTLPSLETIYYGYSDTGRPNESGDASKFVDYGGANGYYERTNAIDAFGHATTTLLRGTGFGTGWTRTDTYDGSTGLLTRSQVPSVLDLGYKYDAYGNLKEQSDLLPPSPPNPSGVRETYAYDPLHRLIGTTRYSSTGAQVGPATTYAYDEIGNLLTKSDLSKTNGYSYGGAGYRLQSIALTTVAPLPTTLSFTYDGNGNVLERREGRYGRSIIYDIDNRPMAVLKTANDGGSAWNAIGESSSFRYGPDGDRYVQLITGRAGSTRTMLYLGKSYERELGPEGKIERWFLPGGAMKLKSNVPGIASGLYYTHGDRLGSSSVLTDNASQVINAERRAFDAFGRPREWANWQATNADELSTSAAGNAPRSRRGFTQHEQIDSTSLVHMNGRVYDADIGRFYGVDPFVQFPANSQSLNPYSYIMNNPMAGTDPTGYLSAQQNRGCLAGSGTTEECQQRRASENVEKTITGALRRVGKKNGAKDGDGTPSGPRTRGTGPETGDDTNGPNSFVNRKGDSENQSYLSGLIKGYVDGMSAEFIPTLSLIQKEPADLSPQPYGGPNGPNADGSYDVGRRWALVTALAFDFVAGSVLGEAPVAARLAAARSAGEASLIRSQLVARDISRGHAFEKHVLQRNEFQGLGIRTRDHFASHIEDVLNSPTAIRELSRGRLAYWQAETGTVVIRNPRAPDGGTAFRPQAGREYFDKLE